MNYFVTRLLVEFDIEWHFFVAQVNAIMVNDQAAGQSWPRQSLLKFKPTTVDS